jgi:hypothetical protein
MQTVTFKREWLIVVCKYMQPSDNVNDNSVSMVCLVTVLFVLH